MIAYIKGRITDIHPAFVVLEINGVGYGMHISLNTYSTIQTLEECKLFTYLHVKNEGSSVSGIELFGFAEREEKEVFEKLISVSGIGVNTARMMLSSMSYREVEAAILQGNVGLIQSIKGIGPKTAQRVILELRDKVGKYASAEGGTGAVKQVFGLQDEALAALVSLGIARNMAEKAVSKALTKGGMDTVEALIKESLKAL